MSLPPYGVTSRSWKLLLNRARCALEANWELKCAAVVFSKTFILERGEIRLDMELLARMLLVEQF